MTDAQTNDHGASPRTLRDLNMRLLRIQFLGFAVAILVGSVFGGAWLPIFIAVEAYAVLTALVFGVNLLLARR